MCIYIHINVVVCYLDFASSWPITHYTYLQVRLKYDRSMQTLYTHFSEEVLLVCVLQGQSLNIADAWYKHDHLHYFTDIIIDETFGVLLCIYVNMFTGVVVDAIDLSEIYPQALRATELTNADAVLNGIAYNPKENVLYVTGKLWKRLYKIQLLQNYTAPHPWSNRHVPMVIFKRTTWYIMRHMLICRVQ